MASKQILVVDDDEELCQELSDILREEGHSVKNTSNPSEGEEWIDKFNFDTAIFDYKMPGITGIDLLKRIKNRNPGTKVFILTGKPFIEKLLEEENVSDLVDGVINKPFDISNLIRKVGE